MGIGLCTVITKLDANDNKFLILDSAICNEENNQIRVLSGTYAGLVMQDARSSNLQFNSLYAIFDDLEKLKYMFGTDDIEEIKEAYFNALADKCYILGDKGELILADIDCLDNKAKHLSNKDEATSFLTQNDYSYGIKDIKGLYKSLKKKIYGQDEAIKMVLMTIDDNLTHQALGDDYFKRSVLLIGGTGVGKTLIATTIAKELNIPYVVVDASDYTRVGYKGNDIKDIFKRLIAVAGSVEKAQNGIIIIDEIDKISRKDSVTSAVTDDVQANLLTAIEGKVVDIEDDKNTINFDTKNVTFIFLGCFDELTNKNKIGIGFNSQKELDQDIVDNVLTKYGMKAEFIARNDVCRLNDLDLDVYKKIIVTWLDKMKLIFSNNKTNFTFDDSFVNYLAKQAMDLDEGARGAIKLVVKFFESYRWEAKIGNIKEIRVKGNKVFVRKRKIDTQAES